MFLKEFKQYFEMIPYKSFESLWIIFIKEDVHNELGFFTQSIRLNKCLMKEKAFSMMFNWNSLGSLKHKNRLASDLLTTLA